MKIQITLFFLFFCFVLRAQQPPSNDSLRKLTTDPAQREVMRQEREKLKAQLLQKEIMEANKKGLTLDSLRKQKAGEHIKKQTKLYEAQTKHPYANRKETKIYAGNCSTLIGKPGAIKSFDQQTLVLKEPGRYYLTEDLIWNPNHCPNSSAIQILGNGVKLDFNGFTLRVNGADSTREFTGVAVIGVDDVLIQNGNISGFTYYGIHVQNSSNIYIDNVKVGDMCYYNVRDTTGNVTPCGINISSVSKTLSIANCTVSNMDVTAGSCAGIQIYNSMPDVGTIRSNRIYNLRNRDGGVQGFSYVLTANLATTDCHVNNLQSNFQGNTKTKGYSALGFFPMASILLSFDGCSATQITGCCDDAHGMSLFIASDITVNAFKAQQINDGVAPYKQGAKATGLEIYGNKIRITNSVVDGVSAINPGDRQAAGYSVCGSDITFENCIAKNVAVRNTAGEKDRSVGNGYGFAWAPDPRGVFDTLTAKRINYSACQAENCQVGFDTWNHCSSSWEGSVVTACELGFLQESTKATRTFRMDRCSESPDGKEQVVTVTNQAKDNKISKTAKSMK